MQANFAGEVVDTNRDNRNSTVFVVDDVRESLEMLLPKGSQMMDSDQLGRDGMALPPFLAGGGERGALMRAKSWTDSLLGPPETWPEALKMAVGICLNSRYPIPLCWRPDLVMLYNDAWRPILGKTKHPAGLGRPGIHSSPAL